MSSIWTKCLEAAKLVKSQDRTPSDILGSVMEEIQELDLEMLRLETGQSAGPDGILGEGVDVIVSVIDLIQRTHPDITEEQFMEVVDRKHKKWTDDY